MTYGNYPDLKKVRRILVIKLRHLGDVLLTTPLFSLLKEAAPEAKIDAYIYKEALPMLEDLSSISGYLLYDRAWKKLPLRKRLFKEIALLKRIRRARYDLVINLTEGDRGAIASIVSASPLRLGLDQGRKKGWYTHLVKCTHTPRHTVERHLDALRCLGVFPKEHERGLKFEISKKVQERVQKELLPFEEYVVIHPVSRWMFKSPLPPFWIELIGKLPSNIVLTSGPEEKELSFVQAIVQGIGKQERVLDLSGKTTLKELGALIAKARALITVDSVPLHMASALKTPVVALFGPSSEIEWGPWQHAKSRVVTAPYTCRPCGKDGCGGSKLSECLQALSAERVLSELKMLS